MILGALSQMNTRLHVTPLTKIQAQRYLKNLKVIGEVSSLDELLLFAKRPLLQQWQQHAG